MLATLLIPLLAALCLWLSLRAGFQWVTHRKQIIAAKQRDAALLATLEEMEADFQRSQREYSQIQRESRALERNQKKKQRNQQKKNEAPQHGLKSTNLQTSSIHSSPSSIPMPDAVTAIKPSPPRRTKPATTKTKPPLRQTPAPSPVNTASSSRFVDSTPQQDPLPQESPAYRPAPTYKSKFFGPALQVAKTCVANCVINCLAKLFRPVRGIPRMLSGLFRGPPRQSTSSAP